MRSCVCVRAYVCKLIAGGSHSALPNHSTHPLASLGLEPTPLLTSLLCLLGACYACCACCACRFHVHYDEAFSSLQVPHFKGFCRFHVTQGGDLEMFGLALERVPQAWREDPRWRTPHGGGNRDAPAHRAKFPSRCVDGEGPGRVGGSLFGRQQGAGRGMLLGQAGLAIWTWLAATMPPACSAAAGGCPWRSGGTC